MGEGGRGGDGRELVIDIKVEGEEGMCVTTEWFGDGLDMNEKALACKV